MTGAGTHDFDSLWDFAAPAESEASFRALLSPDAASGGEAYQLEVLTQIARAQGLQRKFDDAIATLEGVRRRLSEHLVRPRIRHLLEHGRVLNSSGRPQEARPNFEQAWQLATAHGEDALAVDAAHMVAIVAEADESLKWNADALEMAERSVDPKARRWAASLHNNIGWSHHERGDFEAAMRSFQRALEHRIQQGKPRDIRLARWCIARTLRSMGRLHEALAAQRALKTEMLREAQADGYVEEELGECLVQLGRADEALPHFAAAFERLSRDPWLAEREPQRLHRLRKLAFPSPDQPSL